MLGGMMQFIGVGGTVEAGEMNVSWLTFDNANERLGIGVASPQADLHIEGAAGTSGSIYLTDGDATGVSNSLLIRVSGDNASIYNRKDGGTLRLGTEDVADVFKILPAGTPVTNTLVLEQGKIGIGTASPAKILDMTSTTSGFLPPRMTDTQRDAISSPIAGEIIYNTTDNALNFYNGSGWGAV